MQIWRFIYFFSSAFPPFPVRVEVERRLWSQHVAGLKMCDLTNIETVHSHYGAGTGLQPHFTFLLDKQFSLHFFFLLFSKTIKVPYERRRFIPLCQLEQKSKADLLECMSQLASQQKSLPPVQVSARWSTWKYADAGLSAGKGGQRPNLGSFFFLFCAASSAQGYIHWCRAAGGGGGKGGEEFPLPPLPSLEHRSREKLNSPGYLSGEE